MATLSVPKLDLATVVSSEPSAGPSSDAPLETPRTRAEMRQGTARLSDSLARLRELTTRCTPRLPEPELEPEPEPEPEPTPPSYSGQIQVIIDRGYLIRTEMRDFDFMEELKGKKIKLNPPPKDHPNLFAVTLKDLKGHHLYLDVIDPLTGKVVGNHVSQKERPDFLKRDYVWMVTLKTIKKFFTPTKDFRHYYSTYAYFTTPTLTAKGKAWYQKLGKKLPTPRTRSFTGQRAPFGVFQPVAYNGFEFHYLEEKEKNYRDGDQVMIPLVVLDDEGYPLTSPEIPNFG